MRKWCFSFTGNWNNYCHFRPISLCNVLYKIISKSLVNRLKILLPKCISEEHAASIEGRSILDNVLVAFEIIHHLRCKSKWKLGIWLSKLILAKLLPWKKMRGLRQCDCHLIFLYFVLRVCHLYLKKMRWGDIHGVKVCKGAPLLTHLLFADNCFLFCRTDEQDTSNLLSILDKYGKASGQLINYQKLEIFFSANT